MTKAKLRTVHDLETRELRYFVAVAEELHFGRAADRLNMAQPPLSRAIRLLEERLGVTLLDRDKRSVALTDAGAVLLIEARNALDAIAVAARQTQRAGNPAQSFRLVTKAGASHELLQRLLDAVAREHEHSAIDVLLCEVGEQAGYLRDGRAEAAIMHRPVDDLVGFSSADLLTENQVAIVPQRHPLAAYAQLTMADVSDVSDLPMARWPQLDGTYPDGPGPEIHTQSQLAQLVALGKALLIIPVSSRAWQWPSHVAVPVTDAPPITTVLAWRSNESSPALASLVRAGAPLAELG